MARKRGRGPIASINPPNPAAKTALDAPSGFVRFTTPQDEVLVELDGIPAVTRDGGARWETVQRRGRHDITEFVGISPLRQVVPVLFDGYPLRSVEREIRKLEQMRYVPEGGTRPPIVRLSGAVRRTDLKWVIEDIEWSDDENDVIVDLDSRARLRQAGRVNLLRYVRDELLFESIDRSSRTGNGRGLPYRKIRVRQGETTLSDVAKRVFRDRSRARDIARANGLALAASLREDQELIRP